MAGCSFELADYSFKLPRPYKNKTLAIFSMILVNPARVLKCMTESVRD